MNNIFLGNGTSDPLLSGASGYNQLNIENELARMSQIQQMLEQKKVEMENARSQMSASGNVQSKTPIWDEIDIIVGEMSDRDLEFLNESSEFNESNSHVMAILQRESLRMLRPIVENTKDGREALEKHLAIVKKLKKEAANESDRTLDLFKEYTEKYPDKTYSDFLKMKRGKKNEK